MTLRLRAGRVSETQSLLERSSRSFAVDILTSVGRTEDQTESVLDEAADPNTSPWRLATLADDPNPEVRMAVAANPSSSSLTRSST
jgi:hypothetical protein